MAVENDIGLITVSTIDIKRDGDDGGKFYDLRYTTEYNTPFKIENYTTDVYDSSSEKYIYKLNKKYSNIDFSSDNISELEEWTNNSRILTDYHGEFIFSKKLLLECGIGFILSDWLKVYTKTVGSEIVTGVRVEFDKTYLQNWIEPTVYAYLPQIIEDDELYSYYNFKNYQYTINGVVQYAIPDIIENYPITFDNTEAFVKENLWQYVNVTYNNNFNDIISDINWKKFLLSRRFPGVKLQSFVYDGDNITGLTDTYVGPSGDNVIFIFPHYVAAEYRSATYVFTRGCIIDAYDTFNTVKNSTEHPLFKLDMLSYWETVQGGITYMYYYPGFPSATPNKYNTSTDADSYVDITSHTTVLENGTPVIKEMKYSFYNSSLEDIVPNGTDPNTGILKSKNFGKYASLTPIMSIMGKVVTTYPSAEEVIQDKLYSNPSLYKTPSEFYANETATYNENMDDAYGGDIGSDRNWFWLDTLKNWCIYIEKNEILYLMCWNGIDGWDSLEEIIIQKDLLNLYRLANKYLYTQYFFEEGVAYPNDRWGAFVPMRYPEGTPAQVFYKTLILSQDTTSKNYNRKFQSLHDTKIYQTGERNDISNAGMDVIGKSTIPVPPYPATPIPYDKNRQASFGVPTQYCPTLFRQTNGSIALSYIFYARGNGYGVSTEVNPYHIISSENANIRCRDIFGAGDDKTIEKDWKRYFVLDFTEEKSSNIYNSDDDTIYGAASLTLNVAEKKINSIKLAANRPNPTTNNKDLQDYIERWDK